MNNQECKDQKLLMLVLMNLFFPFSIKTSKYSGSCNNINDPSAKLCVPDVAKNMNIKVFNLMSRTQETRHIKWHETCKCKCRLDASLCNSKQRWNNDKWWCECKELIDVCDKGFIWNPSNCECDRSCEVGEYLDYANCKCRKKLVDELVEECSEIIDEVKVTKITLMELHSTKLYSAKDESKCESSCTIYVFLIAKIFTICIGIGTYFIYYKYMNHDKKTASKYDYVYQTSNY